MVEPDLVAGVVDVGAQLVVVTVVQLRERERDYGMLVIVVCNLFFGGGVGA